MKWLVGLHHIFSSFGKIGNGRELLQFFEVNFPDAIPVIGKDRLVEDYFNTKPSPLISIKVR